MLISGRLQTRGENILSEINDMKTMLLHLHILGQIDTTNWNMEKYVVFNEATDRGYITPICLNDMHFEDWSWIITEEGIKYLEQHK
jgi:hypothetical protein